MSTVLQPKQPLATENPFFNKVMTLGLLQEVSKMTDNPPKSVIQTRLNDAWRECQNDLTLRKMFFSVVFSFGDINNREHNIFYKKGIKNVDGGGNSLRKVFLYCLEWMHRVCPKQFYNFLPIYGEYYNLGANTMYHMLWTDRFRGTIKEVYSVDVDVERLTDYIASVLKNPKTTENERKLWAKWLWHIPTGVRKRKFIVTEKGLKKVQKLYDPNAKVGDTIRRVANKQPATIQKDGFAKQCIRSLSAKMNWKIRKYEEHELFEGYKRFRKPYLVDAEATMFSNQTIKTLDKIQLLEWFDKLPSGARFNVQRRLLDKEGEKLVSRKKWMSNKGFDIADVYLEWMALKEEAQQKLRDLSKEDKQRLAQEDPSALKQMERAAKVNTGATKLIDAVANFFKGQDNATTNLVAQSILDKIKLDAPILVCTDISASMTMGQRAIKHNNVTFYPRDFARLATTLFLLKNPSEDLQQMFIRFDDRAEVIAAGQSVTSGAKNRFVPSNNATTVDWLVDPKKTFLENYNSVSRHIVSRNGTHFNVVADYLRSWVESDGGIYKDVRKEEICKYPVFLVISDGDMNGAGSAEQTMRDFQHKMLQYFGWNGLVVVWDVKTGSDNGVNKFKNLTNVMYYGSFNEGVLNQILLNINDMDVIDVFTPLKTLYDSNRYQPVQELVL